MMIWYDWTHLSCSRCLPLLPWSLIRSLWSVSIHSSSILIDLKTEMSKLHHENYSPRIHFQTTQQIIREITQQINSLRNSSFTIWYIPILLPVVVVARSLWSIEELTNFLIVLLWQLQCDWIYLEQSWVLSHELRWLS